MAVQFSHAGDLINFTALPITWPMTACCWINVASWTDIQNDGNTPYFLSHYIISGSTNGWLLGGAPTANNYLLFTMSYTSPGFWSIALPSINTLHHLAVVYDGSSPSNNPTMYVDGVSKSVSVVSAPTGSPLVTGCIPRIGSTTGGNQTLNGKVQDYRIYYGTALNASAIAALAGGGRTIEMNDAGLTFHAPLMYAANRYPTIPFANALAATDYTYDRIGGLKGTPSGSPAGAADMVYGTSF